MMDDTMVRMTPEVHKLLTELAEQDHRPLKMELAWLIRREHEQRAIGSGSQTDPIPGRVER